MTSSGSLVTRAIVFLLCCFRIAHGCQPPTMMTMTTTRNDSPSSSSPPPSSSTDKPPSGNSLDDTNQIAKNFVSYYNDNCEIVKISVITNKPYSDNTVAANAAKLKQELTILESFTGVKLSTFGEFQSEPMKYKKFFSSEFVFPAASKHCSPLKDFTTKAVSFSGNIQKAYFSCGCNAPVEISRVNPLPTKF